MEIRFAGGRSVGKTKFVIEALADAWRAGLKTIMYCQGYELFNPFISDAHLEYIEEMQKFGTEEYRRLIEGSWEELNAE